MARAMGRLLGGLVVASATAAALQVAGCSFNLPARSSCTNGSSCSGTDMGTIDMAPDYNDPSAAGAYKVAAMPLSIANSLQLMSGTTLYMPSDNGSTLSRQHSTFPAVLMAPALRMTDFSQMAPYANRLASHGIVVIQYRPADESDQISYRMAGLDIINALAANMEPAVANHIDTSHIGLAGYDLGAEMSVAIAAQNPAVAGLFLIDPKILNASDNTVQINGLQEMGRVKLANSGTVVMLGEDISNTSMVGAPPCTNDNINYKAFYSNSMTSTIEIVFPNAAHADFVNVYPDPLQCGGGTMMPSDTQNLAIKYMSAYFQWTLLGQTTAMDYLSGQNFQNDKQKYGLTRQNK
jgi:pimeloyl-ACP methyl ester carboxylesterase